jgi:hypothetical protein
VRFDKQTPASLAERAMYLKARIHYDLCNSVLVHF